MIPKRINQNAHAKPADRDAHCVSAMMPLFCENVVFGGLVKRQAMNELTPSARSPPWICVEIKFQAPHAIDVMLSPLPRTVNGTGHTGPSEFCATSI